MFLYLFDVLNIKHAQVAGFQAQAESTILNADLKIKGSRLTWKNGLNGEELSYPNHLAVY